MGENIPRMRTAQQCVDYFKQNDPESSISYCRIIGMAKRGEIPSFKNGRATLINLDKLIEHFAKEIAEVTIPVNYGKVRKIN